MCSLRNNVVKPPATAHEEKIKEKHKDGNADEKFFTVILHNSLLLFYFLILQQICEMAILY